jgi:hypothetical protein
LEGWLALCARLVKLTFVFPSFSSVGLAGGGQRFPVFAGSDIID